MKIGIYFAASGNNGGVYQYSLSLLDALNKIPDHKYFILSSSNSIPQIFLNDKRFKVVKVVQENNLPLRLFSIACSLLSRQLVRFGFKGLSMLFDKIAQRQIIQNIQNCHLDAIFYPIPSSLSYLISTPAIVAVHDVEHKIKPRFKEVSAAGLWQERELIHQNICAKARYLLVPSEIGKEDVVNSYEVDIDKVVILPHLPPYYLNPQINKTQIIEVKEKFNLPDDFILYPAKFWPHKNHLNLVKSLNVLKNKGKLVNLILVGSKKADYSTYEEVTILIKKMRLENQVKILGFVSDIELSALYKMAKAMVMPTFLGPTNIPVLEGWLMGTPVITSDIRGCRDQLGNAGLLVNPNSPKDIADKIVKVYYNDELRKKFVNLGKKKLSTWNDTDFSNLIKELLNNMKKEKNGGK